MGLISRVSSRTYRIKMESSETNLQVSEKRSSEQHDNDNERHLAEPKSSPLLEDKNKPQMQEKNSTLEKKLDPSETKLQQVGEKRSADYDNERHSDSEKKPKMQENNS